MQEETGRRAEGGEYMSLPLPWKKSWALLHGFINMSPNTTHSKNLKILGGHDWIILPNCGTFKQDRMRASALLRSGEKTPTCML
jgi:hypothetical protein